ncbi:13534_t:CDS:2 [Ambispora gerdemannii]|uniref:13534_t:CDS:1 n=1 Tax=Ambispora gerdemannii TaxID=144530 RepID=A0A9N8VJS5_9GLOM|nr:13534_t:CDS:2 [Ambispora gerdemannii]
MSFLPGKTKKHQNNNAYPWSQKKLENLNPFPRFGHSASQNAQNNDIYLFGGISQGKAKNDVFLVDANSLKVSSITTTGTIPPPRSEHTHVNIGEHMIVWGGISLNSEEKPDDSLYILNTVSKEWTKPNIFVNKPIGRFGHTATVVGTTMYIFGGQVDNYYLNDLVALDMTTLNSSTPHWDPIVPINDPPDGRAGHIACAYENRIYIFGGTDGDQCYNDTWCYDIRNNIWSKLECIGYIPLGREKHGACLVDDVMYIFGGRNNNQDELFDLAAFRISNYRWYMFQKMGPSPSPRFALAMAASREKVFVLGGDSNQSCKPDEEFSIHVLDTSPVLERGSMEQGIREPLSPTSFQSRSPSSEIIRGAGGNAGVVNQSSGPIRKSVKMNNQQPQQIIYEGDAFYQRQIRPELSNSYDGRSQPSPRSINSSESQGQSPSRQGSPLLFGTDGFPRQSSPLYRGSENTPPQNSPRPPLEFNNNIAYSSPSPLLPFQVLPPQEIVSPRSPGYPKRPYTGPAQRSQTDIDINGVPSRNPQIQNNIGMKNANPHPDLFRVTEKSTSPQSPGQSANPEYEGGRNIQRHHSVESFDENNSVGVKGSHITPVEKIPTLVSHDSDSRLNDYQHPRQAPHPPINVIPSTGRSSPFGTTPNPALSSPLAITTQLPSNSILYGGGSLSPLSSSETSSINTIRSPIITFEDDLQLERFPAPVVSQERDSLLKELAGRDNLISKLQKRENWLKIELALARKSGYTPETDRDNIMPEGIDMDQLMELGDDGSERQKVLQAIIKIKQELKKAKASIANQAQAASQRIAESERARTAALQEAAYFKAKLTALTNASESELAAIEVERARDLEKRLTQALTEKESLESKLIQYQQSSNHEKASRESAEERAKTATARAEEAEEAHAAALADLANLHSRATTAENQIRDLNSRLAEVNSELVQCRTESSSSRSQVNNLQQSLEQHQRALETANNALIAANERAKEAETLWREARQDITKLEKEAAGLRAELDIKMRDLDRAKARAEDNERLLGKSQKEVDAVRIMMQEGMTELLNTTRSAALGFTDDPSEAAAKITQLQEEVASLKTLQTETQSNAKVASDSLSEAMIKISQMEAASMKVRSETAALQRKLAEALDEMARLKDRVSEREHELLDKSRLLEDAEVKVGMMRDVMSEKGILDDGAGGKGMTIRYKELESKYCELENDYNRLLQKRKDDGEKIRFFEEIDRSSSAGSNHPNDPQIEFDDKRSSNESGGDVDRKLMETRERLKQVEADYQTAVHYVKGTEKMLRRMKEELTRAKKENVKINEKSRVIQEKNEDLEEKLAEMEANISVRKGVRESKLQEYATARLEEQRKDFIREKEAFQQEINGLQAQLERATDERNMMDAEYEVLRKEYEVLRKEHDGLRKMDAQLQEQVKNSESHVVRLNEALVSAQTELDDVLTLNQELKAAIGKDGNIIINVPDSARLERNRWEEHRVKLEREISESHGQKSKLEKENTELEQKWREAENKIAILLDQMEHAVDTYREIEDDMRDSSPRSSGALDSLANELDILKSQWDISHRDLESISSPTTDDDYVDSRWSRLPDRSNGEEVNGKRQTEEYEDMMAALNEVRKVSESHYLGSSSNFSSPAPSVSTTPNPTLVSYNQQTAAQTKINTTNVHKTPNAAHNQSVIDQIRETLNLTPPPTPPVLSSQ